MDFTAVDATTGQVMFSGTTDDLSFDATGLRIVTGVIYEGGWVDGSDVHHDVPASPNPEYEFDWGTLTWVEARTLGQHKLDKWREIKKARETANNAGVSTTFGVFDSDAESRANLAAVVLLSQTADKYSLPSNVFFTLADNSRPEFTMAQIESAAMQVGAAIQDNYDRSYARWAQIVAATTHAAVDAIVW